MRSYSKNHIIKFASSVVRQVKAAPPAQQCSIARRICLQDQSVTECAVLNHDMASTSLSNKTIFLANTVVLFK